MNANGPSVTSLACALLRAAESRREAADRLCDDWLAHHFLDLGARAQVRGLGLLGRIMERWRLAERMIRRLTVPWPWLATTVAIRHGFFEACTRQALERGTDVLVNLGCGYDSKAIRLPAAGYRIQAFEVDRVPTLERKRTILARTGLLPPGDRLRMISCELGEESLVAALRRQGYPRRARAVFLLEGLVHFLDAEQVWRLLAEIQELALPGSQVLFDYVPLDASGSLNAEACAVGAGHDHIEPLRSGFKQGEMAGLVTTAGFKMVEELTEEDACRGFLGSGTRRRTYDFLPCVVAAVA